ncbi:MAG: STAS domain-containing protein [Clostridia bacterium]|nr:STAS domain-containing protein [Clostridia bacterium]
MQINKTKNDSNLTLALSGRLDTNTAPLLEAELGGNLDGVTDLVLDFANLEYISSAGLRVILSAQKEMNARGKMVIKNVCADIIDVFDITGFSDILTIE